jgi:hypothetical protein
LEKIMQQKLVSLITSVCFGLSFAATAASGAITVPPQSIVAGKIAQPKNATLQDAKVTVNIGIGQGYNRRYHGNRCIYRAGNCNYYHQGYYYQNRWWIVPSVIGGAVIGSQIRNTRYSNNHARWCAEKYRSYDLRTNTWLSNSGQVRQCNSPY